MTWQISFWGFFKTFSLCQFLSPLVTQKWSLQRGKGCLHLSQWQLPSSVNGAYLAYSGICMHEHTKTIWYLVRYSHCHSHYSTVKMFSFTEGTKPCFGWVGRPGYCRSQRASCDIEVGQALVSSLPQIWTGTICMKNIYITSTVTWHSPGPVMVRDWVLGSFYSFGMWSRQKLQWQTKLIFQCNETPLFLYWSTFLIGGCVFVHPPYEPQCGFPLKP